MAGPLTANADPQLTPLPTSTRGAGLSDREAARELRTNITWKVAAGLSLTDEGFDPTVLVYWRNRLRASGRPERIFDTVREVVAETGGPRGAGCPHGPGVGLDGVGRRRRQPVAMTMPRHS
jgi:hypothetical protein